MHDDVIEAGGEVKIFSSLHVSGERKFHYICSFHLRLRAKITKINIFHPQNLLSWPALLLYFAFPCQNWKIPITKTTTQIDTSQFSFFCYFLFVLLSNSLAKIPHEKENWSELLDQNWWRDSNCVLQKSFIMKVKFRRIFYDIWIIQRGEKCH